MSAKNQKKGRPRISESTKKLVYDLYQADEMACQKIAETCRISMRSVNRIIKERRMQDEKGMD